MTRRKRGPADLPTGERVATSGLTLTAENSAATYRVLNNTKTT